MLGKVKMYSVQKTKQLNVSLICGLALFSIDSCFVSYLVDLIDENERMNYCLTHYNEGKGTTEAMITIARKICINYPMYINTNAIANH
ncbi:hypothetical protein KP22_16790 [Pectobacterium betavasculorum]|uniref:Uncharacterized protein n=1 Tax=Pectobacterium betavasculorum TaxID=55207 RepID=A0A093RJW8_9GAMM|nr:hypothetical protein [Pectobacterium betavasculorum]KFX03065.1 hypothetical protein KP22_16790 [Pectobacterium betavasculorum]